ncbi:MAG: methylenetetrahydrofolate reductase [Desulfobacter sp.]|nr:MAG: methylenetetrahydrofolate reductase [Desulfobacter sp.]
MSFILSDPGEFKITIEVVPPAGHDIKPLLEKIQPVARLNFHGFSVASNPVARPRMSAMAFSHLLRKETGKPAILHFTVRDHNRLGLQAELWGARALGIDTIIAVTGDPSGKKRAHPAAGVNDLSVFEMIALGRASGVCTGAVLDWRPEVNGMDHECRRIEKKVAAGARFIVTQPVYDEDTALELKKGLAHIRVPVIMGILPLISIKHAVFLHEKVDGIAVPSSLRQQMTQGDSPMETGIQNSRQMLDLARRHFAGACVMPPFDRFDILNQIL